MDHPFRSATFGGFNRQDVLTYLESTSKENTQKLESLQQQLEEQRASYEAALRDLEALRQQASQLEADLKQAQADRDEARRQLDQANAELSAVRTLQSQTARDLESAQADAARWQQSAAQLEPDAQLYRAVKERTAGVELEAHRRAQSVEARARIMAGDLQRQMEQWMAKVEQQYGQLKQEVETSVEQANAQLLAAGGSLSRVTALLDEQQGALRQVSENYAAAVQKKKAE